MVQSNYVVGALGLVLELEWRHTLEEVGLEASGFQHVTQAAIQAAAEALDFPLGARQVTREALGGVEAGFSLHQSQ